ncbi:MAG TPA: hypothetical protein VFI23_18955 [Rhizomicrobium sp.]|nr:hypothetical protein [Rhizomicrobium sp.]
MISQSRGAFFAIAAMLLCGCVAPMTAREAQTLAHERVVKYCGGHCGALALAHTQKIKSRWLVDIEAPRQKFTVIVEDDGNSQVTVWDK